MSPLDLVPPDARYKDSYLAGAREMQQDGHERYQDLDFAALALDFPAFVAAQRALATTPARPGWSTETQLWGVDGAAWVGRLSIRHTLTDGLREYGGHIGYEVRPSRRREGHGTTMLRLALPHARALGIIRVMITCDESNIGSRRIIEANGGQLQDVVKLPYRPEPTMRWWIDLNARVDGQP